MAVKKTEDSNIALDDSEVVENVQVAEGNDGQIEEKEEKERDSFANPLEFFFSTLGYAVGVGNVWRFPYLCYKNGGGVFLIPYFTVMFIIGIPMVYLEFIVGQFTSNGPLTAWTQVKIGRGIGIAMNIANTIYVMYYNLIIAYSLYYLAVSFTSELPWENCSPDYGSPNCVDNKQREAGLFKFNDCTNNATLFKCAGVYEDARKHENYGRCFNMTLLNSWTDNGSFNYSSVSCDSFGKNDSIEYWKPTFPSQDYWQTQVLKQSSGIDETGSLLWHLCLALFVTYLIVYLMLVKGVAIYGKLVYFIATFPYLVLLILGIKGWTLPGAGRGVEFYIVPKWEKLLEVGVWRDAATQIFFTLAISYGGMSTFASYNPFHANILKTSIILPIANCLTSFFAGFVIFGYMGYLSEVTGQRIEDVVEAGQGLAFVVYPYAVTTIAGAPVWSCMFFFMMVLLGLDSTLGSIEVTITSVLDMWPKLAKQRTLTITAIFIFYYFCGLLFCTQSGTYWLEFFNSYSAGFKNLKIDIRCMLGSWAVDNRSWNIWRLLWGFISPLLMILIIITSVNNQLTNRLTLGEYVYPSWTLPLGFLMTSSIFAGLITWIVYALVTDYFKGGKNFLALFLPNPNKYQPKLKKNQILVQKARNIFYEPSNNVELKDNAAFETEQTVF